jgi:hypothetical protein
MKPRERRWQKALVVPFALVFAAGAACAPSEDETDTSEGAFTPEAAIDMWGDDRVGNKFRNFTPDATCKQIPRNYPEIEECFGIGRKCKRADSQEVFVVEERQSRTLNAPIKKAEQILPRAVVTGCGSGTNAAALETSFSMMVGLFSPQTKSNDPILLDDTEVMAYDKTTGLFNYYVFSDTGVTRVYRDGASVKERTFSFATKQASKPASSADARCFGCHVNGAPIFNELSNPWTNWVSQVKPFPETQLGGVTKELVDLAVPNQSKGTSSLAGSFEQIIKAADCKYVAGSCNKVAVEASDAIAAEERGMKLQNGFGHRVLEGKEAGGVGRLLKSVMCETELNYTSATDAFPMEVFWEPAIVGSAIGKITNDGSGEVRQFPIRSEFDKDMELFLIGRMILAPSTKDAVRLVDDENDIMSTMRCDLHKEVAKAGLTPQNANTRIKDAIRSHLAGASKFPWVDTQPARAAYLSALLDKGKKEREEARTAYLREVSGRHLRIQKPFQDFDLDQINKLLARVKERQDKAERMFVNRGPVPIF